MINCKRLGFGTEDVALLVELACWAHPQDHTSWVCYLYKLRAQKVKEVRSEVQGHIQLPREFSGKPGIHEAMRQGDLSFIS